MPEWTKKLYQGALVRLPASVASLVRGPGNKVKVLAYCDAAVLANPEVDARRLARALRLLAERVEEEAGDGTRSS